MKIRVLQESDAALYQRLRLGALQLNPEAFGSTYAREAAFTPETVAARIKPGEHQFVLGAFGDDGGLVGSVAMVRDTGPKVSHRGNIYGMFVAPEARGSGVGRRLVEALIVRSAEYDGLEQLKLTVVSDNAAAKRLYESLGFEAYGLEKQAIKYEGKYSDEILMVYRLNGS